LELGDRAREIAGGIDRTRGYRLEESTSFRTGAVARVSSVSWRVESIGQHPDVVALMRSNVQLNQVQDTVQSEVLPMGSFECHGI
jgi:hypothetical protein